MFTKSLSLSLLVTLTISLFVIFNCFNCNPHLAEPAVVESSVEVPKITYDELAPREKRQVDCLAQNIYHEARGESEEGQAAVAFTTLNRVNDPHWPKSVCAVVKQKTAKTCQFSWWCDKRIKQKHLDHQVYLKCRDLAVSIYTGYGKFKDVTDSSTFYHAEYINPKWEGVIMTKKIGKHIFYKLEA